MNRYPPWGVGVIGSGFSLRISKANGEVILQIPRQPFQVSCHISITLFLTFASEFPTLRKLRLASVPTWTVNPVMTTGIRKASTAGLARNSTIGIKTRRSSSEIPAGNHHVSIFYHFLRLLEHNPALLQDIPLSEPLLQWYKYTVFV